MAAKPSTKKTGKKTGNATSFRAGPDPRRGVGKKGRSGRKPLAFVERCSELTDSVVLDKVESLLADDDAGPMNQEWRWAAEYVTKYSKSPAKTTVEHSVDEKFEQALAGIWRE